MCIFCDSLGKFLRKTFKVRTYESESVILENQTILNINCDKIKSIDLSDYTELEDITFWNCVNLTTIKFGKNNFKLKKLNIARCPVLTTLKNLEYCTELQYINLYDCPNLILQDEIKNEKLEHFSVSLSGDYHTGKYTGKAKEEGKASYSILPDLSKTNLVHFSINNICNTNIPNLPGTLKYFTMKGCSKMVGGIHFSCKKFKELKMIDVQGLQGSFIILNLENMHLTKLKCDKYKLMIRGHYNCLQIDISDIFSTSQQILDEINDKKKEKVSFILKRSIIKYLFRRRMNLKRIMDEIN
jgi:hypothetical protein